MLGLVALALACMVPPAPPPRPAALEITWAAPAECPDETALRERVLALAPLDEVGEGTLFVDGRIEVHAGQYSLRLRTALGELSDEHEVLDASCGAVVDAAALLVAVSIDPAFESEEPSPEPVPAPEALPAQPAPEALTRLPPAPRLALAEAPRSAPRARTVIVLGIGGQLERGSLPGITAGPRLVAELQWEHASVAVFGDYAAPRRTDVVQGVSGLVQRGAGGVLGCGALRPGTLRVPLCGVFEAGGLSVQSRGLEPRNTLRYVWVALGAHAGLERRWDRLGVFGAAEALFPVRRAQVLVDQTALFEASVASVRLIAGLKIFFATDPA